VPPGLLKSLETPRCNHQQPKSMRQALLRQYHAAARKVIESYGGTVEKFIGDAVVGVFGVPVAHEDDPERAVRAGLRIVEGLEGMTRPDGSPLDARVGINTGEALVRLDVRFEGFELQRPKRAMRPKTVSPPARSRCPRRLAPVPDR
jgi:class 3 adenylate cyclase